MINISRSKLINIIYMKIIKLISSRLFIILTNNNRDKIKFQ